MKFRLLPLLLAAALAVSLPAVFPAARAEETEPTIAQLNPTPKFVHSGVMECSFTLYLPETTLPNFPENLRVTLVPHDTQTPVATSTAANWMPGDAEDTIEVYGDFTCTTSLPPGTYDAQITADDLSQPLMVPDFLCAVKAPVVTALNPVYYNGSTSLTFIAAVAGGKADDFTYTLIKDGDSTNLVSSHSSSILNYWYGDTSASLTLSLNAPLSDNEAYTLKVTAKNSSDQVYTLSLTAEDFGTGPMLTALSVPDKALACATLYGTGYEEGTLYCATLRQEETPADQPPLAQTPVYFQNGRFCAEFRDASGNLLPLQSGTPYTFAILKPDGDGYWETGSLSYSYDASGPQPSPGPAFPDKDYRLEVGNATPCITTVGGTDFLTGFTLINVESDSTVHADFTPQGGGDPVSVTLSYNSNKDVWEIPESAALNPYQKYGYTISADGNLVGADHQTFFYLLAPEGATAKATITQTPEYGTLSLSTDGSPGSDSVTGIPGTMVHVTADPAYGYELTAIKVNGHVLSGHTFPLRTGTVITAKFEEAASSLPFAVLDTASGKALLPAGLSDATVCLAGYDEGKLVAVSTLAHGHAGSWLALPKDAPQVRVFLWDSITHIPLAPPLSPNP